MPVIHLFTFIFLLKLTTPPAPPPVQWTDNCTQAYMEALKLNFSKAKMYLNEERKATPLNLVIPYVESQGDFIRCFISEDKADLEVLKKRNEVRISQLSNIKSNSPYVLLFEAEYYLQLALARIKLEEYLSAVYATRKAFRLLEENHKRHPAFKPNLKGLGFLHVAFGAAPRNYQWMLNLIGFHGTIDQGMQELQELYTATKKNRDLHYLHDELTILITFLEVNLVKDKANPLIRQRLQAITGIENKPLLLFAKSVFHHVNAENDSVLKLLDLREKPQENFRIHYLDYMEGIAKLNKLDFTAESSFLKYVTDFGGLTFIKSAYQRLAWIKLLQDDVAGYTKYIKQAGMPENGSRFSDEDKQAYKESTEGEKPNLILLRCRLLTDGGYYQQAIKEISAKPVSAFPSLRDKLEFTYRLARIFDKQNNQEKAIQYYLQTIDNGKNFKYYFAANSALQMGLIYEQNSNYLKSEYYYRLCLGMKDHEYQNSLDQKAKAGINRVRKMNIK